MDNTSDIYVCGSCGHGPQLLSLAPACVNCGQAVSINPAVLQNGSGTSDPSDAFGQPSGVEAITGGVYCCSCTHGPWYVPICCDCGHNLCAGCMSESQLDCIVGQPTCLQDAQPFVCCACGSNNTVDSLPCYPCGHNRCDRCAAGGFMTGVDPASGQTQSKPAQDVFNGLVETDVSGTVNLSEPHITLPSTDDSSRLRSGTTPFGLLLEPPSATGFETEGLRPFAPGTFDQGLNLVGGQEEHLPPRPEGSPLTPLAPPAPAPAAAAAQPQAAPGATADRVPPEIRQIVHAILHPPPNAFRPDPGSNFGDLRLTRRWLSRVSFAHFTSRGDLRATSSLRQYGLTTLGIPLDVWRWLTSRTAPIPQLLAAQATGAPAEPAPAAPPPAQVTQALASGTLICDEVPLGPHSHSLHVRPCEGQHEDGFNVCEICRAEYLHQMSDDVLSACAHGALMPCCAACTNEALRVLEQQHGTAAAQLSFDGCVCDKKWLCSGCREEVFERLAEARAAHVRERRGVVLRGGEFVDSLYCSCGQCPDARDVVRRCAACRGYVIKQVDGGLDANMQRWWVDPARFHRHV